MNQNQSKTALFEHVPVPRAVLQLSTPIVIGSLVTILYNLADAFFVGMLNDPVQNAAMTLAYPVTLAFNAVNNLFGVGVSSAMSRHLGRKAYDQVRDILAVGVHQALGMGRNALLFAICRKLVLEIPLLFLLNRLYPLYGLPFAQLIAEVFLCFLGLLMVRRIFRTSDAGSPSP